MTSLKKRLKLGATGQFPRGKLNDDDEGQLKIAVVTKDKTIEVHFGASVTWIGFSARDARDFANLLIERADAIDGGGRAQ